MANLSVLDLNGTYRVDGEASDSMEPVLKIQGYGWALRKIAAKVGDSMILTIEHTEEKLVQTYSSSVKSKVVEILLSWDHTTVRDDELKANIEYTITYEEDGKVLVIFAKTDAWTREVKWRRLNEKSVESIIVAKSKTETATAKRTYRKVVLRQ
mmetsp:Transcript_20252/g.77533  ORF Transcript_20252/g.77533 Transcript_20252/m.77533 type:complete len:154 (+) Transcript_20252:40-501(+)